ncbi:MAG: site-specific integrase [Leptolyngbya sp. SIOISBB]|nr:site-specific integrase [Leptolyngbya sp. SIOISBB]
MKLSSQSPLIQMRWTSTRSQWRREARASPLSALVAITSHYTPCIEFLFFTGCRPSEAAALTWEKVGVETLRFDCAAVSGMPLTDIQEGTKTQRYREFPINDQLKAVLGKVKASTQDPDALVFSSPKGKGIDIHNFSCRAWTKILAALDLPHRKFYQTRHTFITLCLDAGIDAKDIAKWVGNSPEMIYRHYAGRNPNLDAPEL